MATFHATQPPKSKLCGQYCLAYLFNVSPQRAIDACGTDKGTTVDVIINAVRRLGGHCTGNMVRGQPCGRCIVKMIDPRRPSGNWHWVVYDRGRWYDPAQPCGWLSPGRVVSFMQVF